MPRAKRRRSRTKFPNPHDRTFRFVLLKPERALALFRTHLAPRHREFLTLESLEVFGSNIVDENLEETDNDLVFKVRLADHDLYVFPVLEHQSTQPWWIILRLLIYAARLIESLARGKGGRLPVPMVIVVNQGPKRWTAPTSLDGQFDLPPEARALLDFAPRFSYEVIDLPALEESEICDDPAVRLTLGLMRAVARKRVFAWLQEHLGEFEQIGESDDGVVNCWFTYMVNVDTGMEVEELEKLSEKVKSESFKQEFMTIAEQLEARGEIRGEAKKQISMLSGYFHGQFGGSDWETALAKLDAANRDELEGCFWRFADGDAVREWLRKRID